MKIQLPRIYWLLLLIQLANEIADWFMGPSKALTWLTWLLVLIGGFVACRSNMKLLWVSLLGLPFLMLDTVAGGLAFALGRAEIPSGLTATEAFQGFLIASCAFAVLAMIVAMVGAAIANVYARIIQRRS